MLIESPMLIASPADETEEQFRAFVTELLVSIYRRMPDWLEFNVGNRFEFDGRLFREFICPAGSVSGQIHLRASQAGGISRVIVERGTVAGKLCCWQIRSSVKTEFPCDDLRVV